MLKIVPAVIITALSALAPSLVQSQPGAYYPPRDRGPVIVMEDSRDYRDWGGHRDHRDNRYGRDRDDWFDGHDRDCRKDCRHPRHHKKYRKSGHYAGYPLIIVEVRGLPIHRYSHNRYFYRNHAGMHYWLGRDGRLYLDEKYVRMAAYNDHEYRQWRNGW